MLISLARLKITICSSIISLDPQFSGTRASSASWQWTDDRSSDPGITQAVPGADSTASGDRDGRRNEVELALKEWFG